MFGVMRVISYCRFVWRKCDGEHLAVVYKDPCEFIETCWMFMLCSECFNLDDGTEQHAVQIVGTLGGCQTYGLIKGVRHGDLQLESSQLFCQQKIK